MKFTLSILAITCFASCDYFDKQPTQVIGNIYLDHSALNSDCQLTLKTDSNENLYSYVPDIDIVKEIRGNDSNLFVISRFKGMKREYYQISHQHGLKIQKVVKIDSLAYSTASSNPNYKIFYTGT